MDVLKEKFYREYNTLSRYSPFPCYYNTLDNKYMMGSVTNLDQISNYTIYEVQHGESYDLVALKAYGNPTYYWIICNYNNVSDPFLPPETGTKLKVPVLSDISFK